MFTSNVVRKINENKSQKTSWNFLNIFHFMSLITSSSIANLTVCSFKQMIIARRMMTNDSLFTIFSRIKNIHTLEENKLGFYLYSERLKARNLFSSPVTHS